MLPSQKIWSATLSKDSESLVVGAIMPAHVLVKFHDFIVIIAKLCEWKNGVVECQPVNRIPNQFRKCAHVTFVVLWNADLSTGQWTHVADGILECWPLNCFLTATKDTHDRWYLGLLTSQFFKQMVCLLIDVVVFGVWSVSPSPGTHLV